MKKRISILVLTYNHENFIRKCIDSILNQNVDAEIEILVGEDCSTDNTACILKEKYEGKIKLNLRSENIGASLNFIDLLNRCSGDYIAYIDGDDYMFPGKLAAQLKVFEDNSDVNLVHHNVSEVDFSDDVIRSKKFLGALVGDINDLLKNCQGGMQSCSVMVRKPASLNWNSLIPSDSKIQDMPFIYNALGTGKVLFIDESFAAYRRHALSVTNVTSSTALEKWTRYYVRQTLSNDLANKRNINTSLAASYLRCAIIELENKQFKIMIKNLKRALLCLPYPSKVLVKTYFNFVRSCVGLCFK